MMRLLFVWGGLLLAGTVWAGDLPRTSAGTPLPPEWEGIWSDVDSVYDCGTQALIKVVSRTDTLCAGEEVGDDPEAPPHFPSVTCSGSGDATHLQAHCTAGGLCGEACTLEYTSDLDATRSGETAFWLWTTSFQSNVPIFNSCSLTRRHGTRLQAGPLALCSAVPTKPSTWGNLRARYR
jgi:hypothetical protein